MLVIDARRHFRIVILAAGFYFPSTGRLLIIWVKAGWLRVRRKEQVKETLTLSGFALILLVCDLSLLRTAVVSNFVESST